MLPVISALLAFVVGLFRSRASLCLEHLALRHQLAVCNSVGLPAAFDYLIGEKLMNFVSAASQHPDFARELPRFVSEVRGMFSPDEIRAQLAKIEQRQNEKTDEIVDEDHPLLELRGRAEQMRIGPQPLRNPFGVIQPVDRKEHFSPAVTLCPVCVLLCRRRIAV